MSLLRSWNRHQGKTLATMFESEFSINRDLVFLTDGTQFQPDPNLHPSSHPLAVSLRGGSKMHYCNLISVKDSSKRSHDENISSSYVEENKLCDSRCDCNDCSDEDKKICKNENTNDRLLDTKIDGVRSSPTLEKLSGSGFWKIVQIPSNGSVSFKIPFLGGPHKQIQLDSIVVQSRGKTSFAVHFGIHLSSMMFHLDNDYKLFVLM